MKTGITFTLLCLAAAVALCSCEVQDLNQDPDEFSQEPDTADSDQLSLLPGNFGMAANVPSRMTHEHWKTLAHDYYGSVLKPEPLPSEVEWTVLGQEDLGAGLTRYQISYASADGHLIPAYLFLPDDAGPLPGIIVYHGHGKGKVTTSINESSAERALALHLAQDLGWVVLAPDTRSFGEFMMVDGQGQALKHSDYVADLVSRGILFTSLILGDGGRDLALLLGLEQVDPARIGVAGLSGGCWRALNQGAWYDQVAAVAASGLYISWDYLFDPGRHCQCQRVQALADHLKMEDLGGLIAPRPLLVQWGLQDSFYSNGAEEVYTRTRELFKLADAEQAFHLDLDPDRAHSFGVDGVEEFFAEVFGR